MRERLVGSIGIATLCLASASAQDETRRTGTPPQRFFDWTSSRFTPEEYEQRRAGLVRLLAKTEKGGVLLALSSEGSSGGETFRQRDDFLYFTGLELPQSALAIDIDTGTTTLFVPGTDRRFFDPARRNDFPGRRLALDPDLRTKSGVEDVVVFSELTNALEQWQGDRRTVWLNAGRGFDAGGPEPFFRKHNPDRDLFLRLQSEWPSLPIGNASDQISELRAVKSEAEIEILRRACSITAESIAVAARSVRAGVDERSLEGELERAFKARGSQRVAFASIIKSGPNSLWPWRILAAHYDRRNRKMRDGDLVIFDVGCELDHYASDVGRTFPVSGKFTDRQRELITMVTAVTDEIIAAVRPGVTLTDLQQVAMSAIPEAERDHMQTGHFFGHHIGLAVGDPAQRDAKLTPGMVFTIEPWYYNHEEEVAVFIEDVVLVTAAGATNLTAALPRTPEELEAMTGN